MVHAVWNGLPIKHMSTSHLINTIAWLFRMIEHVETGLPPTKYAENHAGSIDSSRFEPYNDLFVQEFREELPDRKALMSAMLAELALRKKQVNSERRKR